MIYHLAISAETPQPVTQVLAEILQGQPSPILIIQVAILLPVVDRTFLFEQIVEAYG
jgi:hypothetical protein